MVVIGIVSILVLPTLLSNVSERVNSNREANIAQKVTKAVELMAIHGDYSNFSTTEEFVGKLQKYLKIAKVCSSDQLTNCWPTQTVTTTMGNKYKVSDAKTGRDLHTINDTNNVGIVLADGASLILTYNPKSGSISAEGGFVPSTKNLPVGGGKFKEFAYTSNATLGIDFVMDVNGSAGPNAETDENDNYFDIRSFRTASFSGNVCSGIKVNGVCVLDLGTQYSSLNCSNEDNAKYCIAGVNEKFNYKAGAIKACEDAGMKLASNSELRSLFTAAPDKFTAGSYHTSAKELYIVLNGNGTVGSSSDGSHPRYFLRAICVN